ncbi:MAG: hypothetical protein HY721_11120 [Planctomycetes bacterium]|nr:hypothetical protein [Planctomycetota bacterium]
MRHADQVELYLEDFVDGLPEDLEVEARYSLFSFGLTDEDRIARLQEWWRTARPSISWDPSRRRFVARGRGAPSAGPGKGR